MKTCSRCKQDLPLEDFNKRAGVKDGRQSSCAKCNREYYQKYYRDNAKEKARINANNRKRRETLTTYLREAKSVPCLDCKQEYPYYVMQFDHLRDKSFNLSTSVNLYTLEKIKEEVAKCEVVCANCHAVRTWKRANSK